VNLQEKHNSLQQTLKKFGKVLVAYSGGVDSTFLLKVAADTLGAENVLACIAAGPSLPQSQYKKAIEIAKTFGVELQTIGQTELSDAAYSANKADRCFHCKSHLYTILARLAEEKNFNYVICGCKKLTKDNIRRLSSRLNLSTAELPASPCLASRISYGLEITEQRLKQIEEAEEFLRGLGPVEFRVRHHDTIARIEVHPEDIEKVTAEPTRSQIIDKLKSLGFKYITLDLQGFRTGSLNEALTEEEKQKNL